MHIQSYVLSADIRKRCASFSKEEAGRVEGRWVAKQLTVSRSEQQEQ
jgi:hypothetical protein